MIRILIFLFIILPISLFGQEIKRKEYDLLIQKLKEARIYKDNAQLGEIYYKLAIYEEEVNRNPGTSFDYLTRSKQFYERAKNDTMFNLVNKLIAKKYVEKGFTREAIKIYNSLIDYYGKIDNDKELALVYYELGKIYRENGEIDRSLTLLNKAIGLNKKAKDTSLVIDFTFDKIINHIKFMEIDSGLIAAERAFHLSGIKKDKNRMVKSLYYIGLLNFKKKNYDLALDFMNKALSLNPNVQYDTERSKIYHAISNIHNNKGNHREAFNFSVKYNKLNDSIYQRERLSLIDDLSIRHLADEKEKDIRLLEIENKSVLQRILLTKSALYFVGIGCLALLLALYFVIRFYTQKIRIEKIINEQQHEIDLQKIRELEDNLKISSMQSMIVGQEKERERIATDLHDSLGGLLSAVKLQFDHVKANLNGSENLVQYSKATSLLDTAVEEVRNISRNLQPGALKDLGLVSAVKDLINRFEGENYPEIFFQYYNLDERLDDMTSLSIYRIIQELLNNSIKHAEASEILLQLTKEGNEIIIEYEDDGKGIDVSRSKRKGMGLENINSRVNYLKGNISINSQPGEGVSYLIRIPYKMSVA